jgi:hypothetical protein
MTHKSIVITSLALVLVIVVWLAGAVMASESHERCRHSHPATGTPPDVVAVTAQGALFHRPGCTYVHGPVRLESGAAAAASGYTPCTRCLKSRHSTL